MMRDRLIECYNAFECIFVVVVVRVYWLLYLLFIDINQD